MQCPKKDTLFFSAKYWFNIAGKHRDMTETMLIATQNINLNKQNQPKITKATLSLNFAAVVCVYWYTGLSLVCYLENIRVRYVINENNLEFQILLVWQTNGLDFSSV